MIKPTIIGREATHVWNNRDLTYFLKVDAPPITIPGYDATAEVRRAYTSIKPGRIESVPRAHGIQSPLSSFQAVYRNPGLVVYSQVLHNPVSGDLGEEIKKEFDILRETDLKPLLPPTHSST